MFVGIRGFLEVAGELGRLLHLLKRSSPQFSPQSDRDHLLFARCSRNKFRDGQNESFV